MVKISSQRSAEMVRPTGGRKSWLDACGSLVFLLHVRSYLIVALQHEYHRRQMHPSYACRRQECDGSILGGDVLFGENLFVWGMARTGAAKWLPLPEQPVSKCIDQALAGGGPQKSNQQQKQARLDIQPQSGFGVIPYSQEEEKQRVMRPVEIPQSSVKKQQSISLVWDRLTNTGWPCWQNQRPCGLRVSCENE